MKKRNLFILMLSFLMVFVVACGSNKTADNNGKSKDKVENVSQISEKDKYGGTFKGRVKSDPPTLDPAHSTDTTSSRIIRNIFDGLVAFDKDLNVVPAIAKSWEVSEDSLTWTFNLNKGVKFHNGREVKADDFVYTFRRILDPKTKSPRVWLFDGIKGAKEFSNGEANKVSGLRALDDYTLEITLAKPFTPFLSVLAMENAYVVPKEEVEKYGEEFAQHPVGAGPFKFVEWKHDSKVILEKNEDYYVNGRPYLDKVVYRVIPEGSSAFAEYEQGSIYQEVDDDLPAGQIKRIMDPTGDFSEDFSNIARLGTFYIGLNTQKEPFNNKKVRQAINYAVNKKVLTQVVLNGVVKPAKGILPPTMPGYNPDLEGYEFNIEKAKKLLAEAGYPDGLPGTYELAYNTSKKNQSIVEAIQSNLKQIGINITLMNMDWGTYIKKVDNGETQMFRLAWIADYPDPDNFLYVLFHSDNAGPGGNGAFYMNSEVDQMLDKARAMKPGKERLALYQKIEKQIVDDAPWIPVYYYTAPILVKPFVHNYVFTAQSALPLTNVWLEPQYQ
ncbi:ABC transporter substrate-binding protein [Orenia marismortui]|uniref:Peptide/nickel transport system substrate-binding protein/oligopeptide transport system substrate-binding protein n=1 Tax=Orenia marismortui TaxID=46469 RepID=A0A4R8GYQ3_9FIRM|nr:ABC transporter substrate-binding protein [Orenia marismortui]TDX49049.1 peptide/nickel transport system substrate-binding protein/oligopeptide transport system substrate-binding protein [Orenia marismortui]